MDGRDVRQAVVLDRSGGRQARRLERVLAADGWRPLLETTPERFAWTVRVTRAPVALLVAADGPWTIDQVRALRAAGGTPLIVVGRPGSAGAAALLRHGADYVVDAAVSEDELVATVGAAVRRVDRTTGWLADRMVAGGLEVDLAARAVRLDGRSVDLTRTELRLLIALMRQHGRTVASQTLARQIWEVDLADGANALRICMRRLRAKLRDPAAAPRLITSVRGYGYRFEPTVIEMAGDLDHRVPADGTVVVDLLTELAQAFARCRTHTDLAQQLVETLSEQRLCDAAAVHAVTGSSLRLQAQKGHSERWEDQCSELPLRSGYASARTLEDDHEIQVVPRSAGRYRDTLRLCREEDISVMHFLPFRTAEARGCVGLSRRSSAPWSTHSLAVTRAAAALYASQLEARATSSEP